MPDSSQEDVPMTDAEQAALELEPDAPIEEAEDFEALYARLEQLTEQLEQGGLTLEQSVALYEEGIGVARRCQALLAAVEQRIERLRESAVSDE
jgi:exodeoxyribonuclease VII small subunit